MAGEATGDPYAAGDAGVQAQIAAWRERGAERIDPLRLRYIEALARRAATHQGLLRHALDARLVRALALLGANCAEVKHAREPQQELARSADRGPLGQLVGDIDGLGAAPAAPVTAALEPESAAGAALPELKTVQRFRRTWNRLSVDRQLSRSLDKIPENPGPLNSHLLVLRALRRMQEISPAYLEHFVAHTEALWWLDRARADPSLPASGKPVRQAGAGRRKPGGDRYG